MSPAGSLQQRYSNLLGDFGASVGVDIATTAAWSSGNVLGSLGRRGSRGGRRGARVDAWRAAGASLVTPRGRV